LIDGIIIEPLNLDHNLWVKSSKLHFSVLTVVETGEEIGSKKAHYNGLDFIIEPKGKMKVKGSIHKFFNDGEHNADRFTYENFQEAISRLSEFGIVPETTLLRGFELGLNLDTTKTKINTKAFLDSILYCRGVEPSDMEINGKTGYGYNYKTTNIWYKFYDKAEQSYTKTELLRIETKVTRMRAVQKYGLVTLADLLNKEKLAKVITDKYLKFIDETIYFEWDQIPTTRKIPNKHKSKFKDLRNPAWWIKDERSRKERSKNKLLLEKLINQYAKRNIKIILKDLISLELQAFSRSKNGYEYTEFDVIKKWNSSKNNADKKGTDTQRIVRCTFHERSERMKSKKYCLVCGKDISHSKKDAKYCSDNRKCRDKAYNLKVSEQRKAKRTQKQKEILKLIDELGHELTMTKTTNPSRKKIAGIPSKRTSIIVTVNGIQKLYNGAAARFFIKEFERKTNCKSQKDPNDETNST
jgi:predicted nucleic acid-binding Zn ribbon protein